MIFAEGQALLENQSAPPEIKIIKINSGLKILIRGTPADLIAVSSFLSERFPNAIILATRIAIGRARFTILAEAYHISFVITNPSSPFPIKSSAYTQRNCMSSTNSATGKVIANGPKKALSIM